MGRIGKPHGIKGEATVLVMSDDPARFAPGSTLLTHDGELEVESSRDHRGITLVKFTGVDDRNAAEALRGTELYVPREARRGLDTGEFWPEDLVGLAVVDVAGGELGRVAYVVPGPAQDRIAVRTSTGVTEVPFVAAIVTDVDLDSGRITLDPPEGLL